MTPPRTTAVGLLKQTFLAAPASPFVAGVINELVSGCLCPNLRLVVVRPPVPAFHLGRTHLRHRSRHISGSQSLARARLDRAILAAALVFALASAAANVLAGVSVSRVHVGLFVPP